MKRICFFLLAALFLQACRKSNVKGGTPPPVEEQQLLITGSVFNGKNGHYEPCYWQNGKFTALPFVDGQAAYSYGATQSGADVFIAGFYEPRGGAYEALPCYWKNGQEFKLPVNTLTGAFSKCIAIDVKSWQDQQLILGRVDQNPVVWWVRPTGATQTLELTGEPGTPYGGCRTASTFSVENDYLYVTGDQVRLDAGNPKFVVGYWKIHLPSKQVSWHVVEDNLAEVTVFHSSVAKGVVYMAGEKHSAGQDGIAAWNSYGPIDLEAFKRNGLRMHKVYGMPNGRVYFIVNDFRQFQPAFLRADEGAAFQHFPLAGHTAPETVCTDMAFGKEKTATIGRSYQNNKYQVWSEVDGNRSFLEFPASGAQPLLGGAAWITIKH